MDLPRNLYLNDRLFYGIAGCILIFLASYSWSPLFYVGILGVVLIVVLLTLEITKLFTKRSVAVRRITQSVFSLHEDNVVRIEVESLCSGTVHLRIIDEIPFQFARRDLAFTFSLAPLEKRVLEYQLKPTVRGEYGFGDIQVFVSTSTGLVSRRESEKTAKKVAVYPSILLMARQQRIAMQNPSFNTGENRNRRLGQSYEFDQVRAYVPGNDVRHINWKASSALGDIMVNTYNDERSQQIYALIDKGRVMKAPVAGLSLFDHAVNATLAFSNIVLKKQDKAGMLIFSKTVGAHVKADLGQRQLKKIMYSLYKEQYDYSESNYEQLYTTIRRTIPNRSLLFLYTNFDTLHSLERNLGILRLISKYHLLVVVFFEDTELEAYAQSQAESLLDIYQITMARRFLFEKTQIARELERHGIHCLKCPPDRLSTVTINKYLELKGRGRI